jgi:hypothetical protein
VVNETPAQRRPSEPLIGGVVLIVIGAALLLAQLVPDLGRFVVLAIGLALLGLFALRRDYGALVGGSIVTGVGTGVGLAPMFAGELSAAVLLVSIGGGFIAIWLVSNLLALAERHWWPLVPGLIVGSVGVALALGRSAVDMLAYWPLALIVVGGLILVGSLWRGRSAGAGAG